MPTDTKPGVRPLDTPCWTVLAADGTPAFEDYEPHYLTEAEAVKAAAEYGTEDVPPARASQLEKACWVGVLLCGEDFIHEGYDYPSMHFGDEADVLVSVAEAGLFPVEPGVFACDSDTCQVCLPYAEPRLNRYLADKMVDLGNVALAFGRVERATFHPGGKRHETDTDHTVMLGLVACALASEFFPELNVGEVAQLALGHDLPEVYAGDASAMRLLGVRATAEKEQKERAGASRLHAEFHDPFPWVSHNVRSYQRQDTPEAVFLWAVDKMIAKITHILDGGAAFRTQNMSVAELTERFDKQLDEIRERAAQFPRLADLHQILVGRAIAVYDESSRPACPVVDGEPCPGNEHGQVCTRPCLSEGAEQ